MLGERLVAFLRDGDAALLEDLLYENETLVTFALGWLPDDALTVGGAPAVAAALKDLRESLTRDGIEGKCKKNHRHNLGPGRTRQGAAHQVGVCRGQDPDHILPADPLRCQPANPLQDPRHNVVGAPRRMGVDRIAIMPLVEPE